MTDPTLTVRRVRFEYPEGTDPVWNHRFPEFAHGANSISLLMPYAEPYFIHSVRDAIPQLPPELAAQTEDFARQEGQHFRAHRQFNDLIGAQYPAIPKLERLIARTYGWLDRTRSLEFNLAFAAGSETIAFALARWTEDHLGTMFDGADPVPATLYLWHLAEEVEHKSCAYDVFEAVDGSRLRYTAAMSLSFGLLAFFCTTAVMLMLWKDRRLFHPITLWRLLRWALSLSFSVMPVLAASTLPSHHPSSLTDPLYLPAWLRQYDPATETMPLWGSGRSA